LKIQILKALDRIIGGLLVAVVPVPRVRQKSTVRSVLVVRPGGIGDAVLLVPLLQRINTAYPEASIEILAEKRNADIFRLCPVVGEVFRYDILPEFLRVLRRRYDVVIDSEQWHRLSALTVRFVRSEMKIGFATNSRKRCFTHPIAYRHDEYELQSFSNLLRPLGLNVAQDKGPFLKIPEGVFRELTEKRSLAEEGGWVVIFPGASIPERRWGGQKFHEVARGVLEQGLRVVIVGGLQDVSEAEDIASGLDVVNLAGRTDLVQTAAILGRSVLLVSGDSGLLHVAVGLGVPTVSIFGPGIEKKWAPKGRGHRVINWRLPCSPCTRFGYTPKCERHVECMNGVDAQTVLVEALELLLQGEERA